MIEDPEPSTRLTLNSLLAHQIQKLAATDLLSDPRLQTLISEINKTYHQFETGQKILEKAVDKSSKELVDLNTVLRKDINERILIQNYLQLQNTDLQLLLENLDEVLFSIDVTNHKITQISAACQNVFGFSQSDFYEDYNLLNTLIHPDDRRIVEQQKENLTNGKKTLTRYRIINNNGSIKTVENRIFPTLDSEGRLIRLDGITRDITENIQNLKKLQQSEANATAVIENTNAAIWSLDKNGCLVTFNSKFAQYHKSVTGNLPIKGANYHTFLKEHWKSAENFFEEAIQGKKLQITNEVILNGETKYFRIAITPIVLLDEITGITCFSDDVTEAVIADQRIRKSEANLLATINNTEDAIASVDSNYNFIAFNRSWEDATSLLYGRSPKIGENFFLEEAGVELNNYWRSLLERAFKGENFKVENKAQLQNKTIATEISFKPIKENSKVTGVVCLARDITAEKESVEQVKASELRFRSLLEHSNDLLALFDQNNQLEFISNATARTFEYTTEEFLKADYMNMIHIEDQEMVTRVFTSAKEQPDVPVKLSYRAFTKSGQLKYFDGVVTNMLHLPHVRGLIANCKDITLQRVHENNLVENEKKYRNLFQQNPMCMWVIDDEALRFLDVNASTCKHYGYTKDEFLKLSTLDIRPHQDRENFVQFKRSSANNKVGDCGVWKHLKKDGTEIMMRIHAENISFEGQAAKLILGYDITEKVKAEEKLRLSNERYEYVTKATHDAIWDWNFVTNDLYWSEGYEKMFGYEKDRTRNIHSWSERIHPDDIKRVTTGIANKINNPDDGFWEDEYRYYRADGSIAHIFDRGFIVFDDNKNPIRMVGAMQDLTRKKLTEQSLQQSEANLRNVFENTHTAYILLDKSAQILSFNRVAENLSLRTMPEVIATGKNYVELMGKSRAAEVKKAISEVLTSGRPLHYEVPYIYFEKVLWLEVSMHPIIQSDKTIIGLSVAATDITERKKFEERLIKSEANLKTIFNNTNLGFVLLDKHFNIISYNQQALQGYDREMGIQLVENGNFWALLSEERKNIIREKYEKVLKGNKISYEIDFIKPDLSLEWYNIQMFPVSGNSSEMLGIIIASENITARKNTELEKEKMTREIIQRNKDLEQFAYIISHNLRSPVANITGLATILKNSSLSNQDYLRCMDGLMLSVKKLDDVIIDLNYILQVRREINEKKETIKFSELITDIKTSINNLIVKEKVSIITDFQGADEFFTLKSYLNSIFFNLILNSIKYRKHHISPEIRVKSFCRKKKLVLEFEDNGLGIDLKSNAGKVFGLYKKFHDHTDGKGMGLYMVKTQVEILGGRIDIESEVDKGTLFRLEFDI